MTQHYRSPYTRDTDEDALDRFDPLGPRYGAHGQPPPRRVLDDEGEAAVPWAGRFAARNGRIAYPHGPDPTAVPPSVAAKAQRLAAIRDSEPDACADVVTRAAYREPVAPWEGSPLSPRGAYDGAIRAVDALWEERDAAIQRAERAEALVRRLAELGAKSALKYTDVAGLILEAAALVTAAGERGA